MRRYAIRALGFLLLSPLALSGCAFNAWHQGPFWSGPDPYRPQGDSENLRRALGKTAIPAPLAPEAGNVWPGPLPPQPTLADLVKQESEGKLQNLPQLPGQQPPPPPVPSPQGPLGQPPALQPTQPRVPPVPNVATPSNPNTPALPPAGGVVNTPQGPAVTSGGTGSFKSITMPNGVTGIVVPNGNGTNTVILSNGTVQTVPVPR
jgi:hypothetical protein